MEYNNYYSVQSGHPTPPVMNQQHVGPQMQQPPVGGQMMHATMSPQNARQALPPGPQNHHQQIQQHQQHLGHHPQQMPSQQQHPNYHQIQPAHPHGPPVSHSGSPHPQPQQQQHHNHQPSLIGPSSLPSQQHHMHPQSPIHHGGLPPLHMQQQQQIVRPQGPPVMNHPLPGLQQPPHHHNHQSYFSGGPIPQPNMLLYPQQNQHHHQHQPPHHHHHQHHHQPPSMHNAQITLSSHHPHAQQGIGRNSPYYPTILQTEFRIIELNRRLQCRPILRHPVSPLPNNLYPDESLWWERFASEFFEDDATLTLRILEDKPVEYTIGRTLIPKFFKTYFDDGVTDLSINLRNPKEACLHPHMITLDCDQALIVTNNIFKHNAIATNQGFVVHTEGHLILDFVSNNFDTLLIKSWKFYTKGCREYIDRSMTAMGLPSSFLVEPVARQGFSKSIKSYLKMCETMEPMQDLMFLHKQTKLDPRACLKKLLWDRCKFRSGDDNRNTTNKRRKRKPSAAPALTGAGTNKKSKASVNSSINNNSGLSNNIMMSPSGTPSFSLASQDVMVVGEPSMMGGDFGDDNERMITRLENTQYDPTASTVSNTEESDILNISAGNDARTNNDIESSYENHTLSPSLVPQQQQQQQQMDQQMQQHLQQTQSMQVMPQQNQIEQLSSQGLDQHQAQRVQMNVQEQHAREESAASQINLIEHVDMPQHEDSDRIVQQPLCDQVQNNHDPIGGEELLRESRKHHHLLENSENNKFNPVVDANNDSNLVLDVNSVEHLENHAHSIQAINDESDSSSQLPCSTAPATSAIEQQQPVDNGVV